MTHGKPTSTLARPLNHEDRAGHPLPSESIRRLISDPELLAHVSDVIAVIDTSLRFVYVSRETNQPVSALIGRSVLESVAPQDRARFGEACTETLSSGQPQVLIASDVAGGFWETRLVPTWDDGRPVLFISSTDVTHRVWLERLGEPESRQRLAIESSGIGTWTWDAATDQVTWDVGLCRILGRDPIVPPRGYADYLTYVHPDDRERVDAHIAKCLRDGVYEEYEHRLVRSDGSLRHVVCRGSAEIGPGGVIVSLRGTMVDLTTRKLLEEQLRQVQKMDAMGQLTAGIAHNFNNLLSIALPNVELCRMRASPDLHGPLDDVLHAVSRASELVRQLMRFARQEVGSQREHTDLGALVHQTAKICRATFSRRIGIDVVEEPALPAVSARAGEIEQVLLNLCINARDAFEEAQTPEPRIRLCLARADAATVRIRISDNGPGMDERVRTRLFEPFFTTKEAHRGTGLGLASAYGIVVDHGGTIRCESAPGVGASFIVELPVVSAPVLAQSQDTSPPPARGSEVVLLVDDEAPVRRALRAVLEQAGFRVLEAADGGEGLTLLESRAAEIDVIVLDRSMPRVSGEQFLAQVARAGRQVPVVLLTGHAGDEAELEEVDAVMIKPPRASELLRTIRQVIDVRQA